MLDKFIAFKDACNQSFFTAAPLLLMVTAVMRRSGFAGWWVPAGLLAMMLIMKLHQVLSR